MKFAQNQLNGSRGQEMRAQQSVSYKYFENRYRRKYIGYNIGYIFHFTIQYLLGRFFIPINIQRISPDARIQTCAAVHIIFPLRLSDFKHNWNVMADFNKTSRYQVSQASAVLDLLHEERWKNRQLWKWLIANSCNCSLCVRNGMLGQIRKQKVPQIKQRE
jgi:hypothetical protein